MCERRQEMYNLFRRCYPDGDSARQRQVCESVQPDRVEVYIAIFKDSKREKAGKTPA